MNEISFSPGSRKGLEEHDNMERKMYDIIVEKGPYGPLKWSRRAIRPKDRVACLLGRFIALYDLEMDFSTNLESMMDEDVRVSKFRELSIWSNTMPKKVKSRYSSICMDCPGINMDRMREKIDRNELKIWYSFQMESMNAWEDFYRIVKSLWGGRHSIACKDLGIPYESEHQWNRGEALMSEDVMDCLYYAIDSIDDTDILERDIEIGSLEDSEERIGDPYVSDIRNQFIELWKEKEKDLLQTSPDKR